MPRDPRLRRRPACAGSPRSPPRANDAVNKQLSDPYALFSAVVADLLAYKEAFGRELGLKDVKPWSDFFAHFKPPRAWTLTVIDERVTTNYLNYRGNYSIIAAGSMALGIVMNITALFAIVLCALLLSFLFPPQESSRVVTFGERVLTLTERLAAAVLGVACILGLTGTWAVLLFYVGTGIVFCIVHSIFRPRTLRSKANRLAEDVKAGGGFSIEGAQTFVERTFNINPSTSQ